MSSEPKTTRAESELLAAVRQAARQEQFLEVVSAEEAKKRFEAHLDLKPLTAERVSLANSLGRSHSDRNATGGTAIHVKRRRLRR